MEQMTSCERVRLALNHQEADRVPIDLGGWQSGISYETYERVKALLDIEAKTRLEERAQGLAWVDEPVIAPKHYKYYIKPREAALVEFAKKHSNAKIALHTCGASYEFIPDILDAGYDILNPIQTTAAGMDPVRLKQEFGKDIVFWEAIDTQRVLPFGTEEDVKQEVHKQIRALAPDGGYILAPCHNIQALTPAENVVTMFQAALEFGIYPIPA